MAGTSSLEGATAFNAASFNAPSGFPPASTSNNTNNMQRTSKRRSSGDNRVGRSFKRLRLDTVHVPNPNGGASGNANYYAESQSTGTLSVGTMGGDLESNDEDLGEEDDETEEGDNGSGPGGSVASSWVASLAGGGGPNNNFRKRRAGVLPQTMMNDNFDMEGGGAAMAMNAQSQSYFRSLGADDNHDDAATCSGMTTGAIAPRRRQRTKRGGQQKRLGFIIEAPAGKTGNAKCAADDDDDDDLDIEDLEVDSILTNGKYVPSNLETMPPQKMTPPMEQIPDPLLVAAQHAAGGTAGMEMNPHGSNVAAASSARTVLVMGDCYSSVTEEETSLAEDEASISAISIGANTTVSALSGGMEGSLQPCASTGSGMAGSFDQADRMKANSMQQYYAKMDNTPMKSNNNDHVNNATAMVTSPYAPLNSILGGLHKERIGRLSTNRPPSRGESSLHSMGSEGAHSGGAASYRSLPNNVHAAAWNMSVHGSQPQPPSFVQQKPLAMMDEDAEMEEADDGVNNNNPQQGIGATGSFHSHSGQSVASFHGSRAGSFGNLSRASGGSAASGAAVSGGAGNDNNAGRTWKQQVNLPSHSSLY